MKVSNCLKLAAAAIVLFSVSACANKATGPDLSANQGSSTGGAPTSGVTPGSQGDLEQNVGHRVFFGYDQHTLSPQAQATLARQAQWLRANPGVRILVAGNCDERGTREYNLALGARRAEAARQYLVSQGVEAGRITTVSYGKERPIDPRSTEEAWSMNRNATSTVVGVGA